MTITKVWVQDGLFQWTILCSEIKQLLLQITLESIVILYT